MAAPSSDPIVVVEMRVGPPSSNDELTRAIVAQFEQQGFAAAPDSIARVLGGRMPRPGIMDQHLTAAQAIESIQSGSLEWSQGRFEDAVRSLSNPSTGLPRIFRNPALLATDTKNLDTIFRGMAALALSEWKLGDKTHDRGMLAKSHDAVLDLIRAFRTRPLPRDEFAPDAIDYYRKIQKDDSALGQGQLFVNADSDHVIVFVDGQMHGVGSASLTAQSTGPHRIFMQVPSHSDSGRRYEVSVRANEDARLKVRWDVDSAFLATDNWTGFAFETESELANRATCAGELASWTPRGLAAIVERTTKDGKPALKGALYDSLGQLRRTRTVQLSPGRDDALRELAIYLSNGTPDLLPTPEPVQEQQPAEPPVTSADNGRPVPVLGLTIGGVGLLAMAAGATFYVSSPADDHTMAQYNDRRTPAVEVFVGGAAALGVGTCLALRDRYAVEPWPAVAIGAGVGSIAAGTMLFLTHEDPPMAGFQRPTYRATEVPGIIVGSAGLVLTGVGIWLAHSERDEVPVVSVSSGGASVGWAGRF